MLVKGGNRRRFGHFGKRMTKILSLVIVLMMVIQIIKPLGLPGLRRRSDFWKLALVALGAISLTVVLSHGG